MTFVTSMTVNISRVWRDIEHQRLAVCELSNQLEVLTQLEPDELIKKIDRIEPSEFCKVGLDEPTLDVTTVEDDLGQRIDLEIKWKHRTEQKKVRLSGWSIGSPAPNAPTAPTAPNPSANPPTSGTSDVRAAEPSKEGEQP